MHHDDEVPGYISHLGIRIDVPRHWSPQTAEVIFDFICDLEQAVFEVYEDVIVESWRREATELSPPDDDLDGESIPY